MLACVLAACATPHEIRHPPAKPPAAPPQRVAKPASLPREHPSINPQNYQQEKERLRTSIARNPSESLTSGEAGYYMDVLHGRLRQIGNDQFGLAQDGKRIVVTLLGGSSGAAMVGPSLPTQLKALAKVLSEYRKTLISVQAEAPGDATRAELCTQLAARTLSSGGVTPQHIAVLSSAKGPSATDKGDLSGCKTVVLQLEPIVRAE